MNHALQAGLIPAIVMPFKTDGSVDWPTYERYIASVAAASPTAIAVNMAAAEATALEPEEQVEAIRVARKAVAGVCPIISGLIAPYTAGAVRHGRRLTEAGAEALVVFPPLPTFMSKPLPLSIVTDYHAEIASACGLPIIAFQTANAGYPKGAIRALAGIPNLVAIKDAAFDIDRTWEILQESVETDGRVAVLTGNDTFILEALLMGCGGALIGFAATATAELARMQALAAERKATEAYAIWDKLGPLARICWSNPLRDYRARMKYVLMKQGVFPSDTTRAPQTTINADDRGVIDRLFEKFQLSDRRYLPASK
jgi:4-hydroxy-tetrahydrodipicolinate synthase